MIEPPPASRCYESSKASTCIILIAVSLTFGNKSRAMELHTSTLLIPYMDVHATQHIIRTWPALVQPNGKIPHG
jgi:hypothetical protein